MKIKNLFKNLFVAVVIFSAFVPAVLWAQITPAPSPQVTPAPSPVKFNIKIDNPFKGGDNLMDFIKTVINEILIPIGGVIAVLVIMYAGFLYVTARGDTGKIKTAHDTLLYGVIGAAILLGAWVISEAIGGTIDQLRS